MRPDRAVHLRSNPMKLLELISASNKIAFALLLAGLVLLLDQHYQFLPFPIPSGSGGWITTAAVLGAWMLVASITAWMLSVVGQSHKGFKSWWQSWTVMDRLDELTHRERLALYWIAYHPEKPIVGSRYLEPFKRLCDK